MNAPICSLPEGQMILGEARNSDEMLEIWRARKAAVGLSNFNFDELANLAKGHCDKLFGPTGSKQFGPLSFTSSNWTLAIKWVAVVDHEHAKHMEEYWRDRQRDISNVRIEPNRVSKQIIARAKPIVLKELGEKLALALGDIGQLLLGMKLPDRSDQSVPSSPSQVVPLKVEPAEPAKLAAPQSEPAPISRAHLRVVMKRSKYG